MQLTRLSEVVALYRAIFIMTLPIRWIVTSNAANGSHYWQVTAPYGSYLFASTIDSLGNYHDTSDFMAIAPVVEAEIPIALVIGALSARQSCSCDSTTDSS